MKKLLVLAAIVSFGLNALPVFAQPEPTGKDDRLVNCTSRDSLPERITRLEKEIAKGERVYTAAELDRLERKRDEAKGMLRVLMLGGKR
ncbi:hypothetical protein KIP69_04300 [Geobacter sulfurreducens]|jgi:hypothetical protein|uniref:hypothetical protein n=1 Tax=Geobacter sulfurreducens TaxID=35554 RepID=UPI0001D8F2D7|nr:hypothetical protein [Geobacter sulfurreducens]ADI83678.1 hypothetical protein KN400_0815 [Geobacter sulfurreducens KN400]AJY70577.1 hypothetical protein RW64_13825 [Geobacter sulfurreducens]QVW36082.1 hypothetical protein KIP69_04300 [Geobacter sulfurreducens]UTG93523.1 hypothetical protein J8622_04120 [Geobacter sulfurreducens]